MGRNLDARRKVDEWYEEHDAQLALLGEAIGKTVKFAIRDSTVTEFADKVHYTRTTLTVLLSQKATDEAQKGWTLSLLLAISKALGVKLSALIAEAEEIMEGGVPGLQLRIASTAPRSRERLQKLIYAVVNYCGDLDAKQFDGLLEVLYRVKDIEYAVPTFWESYSKGVIGDQEAVAILKAAAARIDDVDGEAPPFWAALRQEWEENPLSENN